MPGLKFIRANVLRAIHDVDLSEAGLPSLTVAIISIGPRIRDYWGSGCSQTARRSRYPLPRRFLVAEHCSAFLRGWELHLFRLGVYASFTPFFLDAHWALERSSLNADDCEQVKQKYLGYWTDFASLARLTSIWELVPLLKQMKEIAEHCVSEDQNRLSTLASYMRHLMRNLESQRS